MKQLKLIGVALIVVLIVASFSIYTVKEQQKAIMFRLGEIVDTQIKPGIHFKTPFVNNVRKFDARVLTMDAPPEQYLTSEKKNVTVDSFVKWRIADVGKFYRSMGGDERNATTRISQIIKNGLRSEFGKRTIQEAVSGERNQIMDVLLVNARRELDEFGIEVVDVRVKRIDLPKNVSSAVYSRMEAERERVAKDFRSRGAEAAERIRAEADRKREVIIAEAFRDAETIKGEGDATATNIYGKAYSKDPEFYSLSKSLSAYKNTFKDKNDIVLIRPDSEFFKYFNDAGGK